MGGDQPWGGGPPFPPELLASASLTGGGKLTGDNRGGKENRRMTDGRQLKTELQIFYQRSRRQVSIRDNFPRKSHSGARISSGGRAQVTEPEGANTVLHPPSEGGPGCLLAVEFPDRTSSDREPGRGGLSLDRLRTSGQLRNPIPSNQHRVPQQPGGDPWQNDECPNLRRSLFLC